MSKQVTVAPILIFALVAALSIVLVRGRSALAFERTEQKPAIVLAAFGTTEPAALKSILNIRDRVSAAFPNHDVHLAFTSNIIRSIWRERAADSAFIKANPGIPAEIYDVKNALSVLSEIQEKGARLTLVQSLHVTDGEEYRDLEKLVSALGSYDTVKPVLKPFPWMGTGEPALGLNDGQPAYIERAVKALAPLAERASAAGASLVLMGHGNEHMAQNVYARFQAALRAAYGPNVYVGTVEAPPHGEEILAEIKKNPASPSKALLAPMMVVAGDHALNDMAGEEPDSWASVFKAGGLEVETYLEGLGSNDSWADIYVEHLNVLAPKVEALRAKDEG